MGDMVFPDWLKAIDILSLPLAEAPEPESSGRRKPCKQPFSANFFEMQDDNARKIPPRPVRFARTPFFQWNRDSKHSMEEDFP